MKTQRFKRHWRHDGAIFLEVNICFSLLMQLMDLAFALARDKAGSNNAARIAIMAMTTSNSMSVKPRCVFLFS
jgi:hypothetical protein